MSAPVLALLAAAATARLSVSARVVSTAQLKVSPAGAMMHSTRGLAHAPSIVIDHCAALTVVTLFTDGAPPARSNTSPCAGNSGTPYTFPRQLRQPGMGK